ncbi:MAG: glycosyltransferase [Fischerella sp.]|jgi:glycosyltransferase involved in cell wall biosynthesis|uniref:glycosyltransferase n=1 Tax=Fischerella sp. TaxID=1191 RepID=UPI0018234489|nr:glycosyltransferase [Fischerella sp.]NWF58824.1 glycosyltransferase [Fischerella sp.]
MDSFDRRRERPTIVLNIAPITDKNIAGLTVSVPSLTKALHQVGVKTGLLTTTWSGRYSKPEPYQVISIKDLPLHNTIAALPEPLNQPDLLVFHSTYIPVHALLIYEAFHRKIPYIICPRGGMTKGAQQVKRWKKMAGNIAFFKWMVRHAMALHCLTEQEAADVKAWNRPVFVVGNGVDIPPVEALANPGKKTELEFVFLGRLDINHKGLDLLLEACAMIQEDLRDAKVKIGLYGPDVAGVTGSKTRLEQIVKAYQIQDIVSLQDPVWGKAKQAVLQGADLFLHTSRYEGHPVAVLEALCFGVPCLLTPGTNVAAEVAAAGAGWAVEAQPSAIASGIRRVLAERPHLPIRGQAARRLVEEKYAWDRIASQLLKEYMKLLDSGKENACCNC